MPSITTNVHAVYPVLRAMFERTPRVTSFEVAGRKFAETRAPVADPATLDSSPVPVDPHTPIYVLRPRRNDVSALSVAIAKSENRDQPLVDEETLVRVGKRGYRIALADRRIVAFAAWEVENLVALVRDIWAESPEAAKFAIPKLLGQIEAEARELVCEIVLLFVDVAAPPAVIDYACAAGYCPREISALHKNWRPIAQERMRRDDLLWCKSLREQMVTEPF